MRGSKASRCRRLTFSTIAAMTWSRCAWGNGSCSFRTMRAMAGANQGKDGQTGKYGRRAGAAGALRSGSGSRRADRCESESTRWCLPKMQALADQKRVELGDGLKKIKGAENRRVRKGSARGVGQVSAVNEVGFGDPGCLCLGTPHVQAGTQNGQARGPMDARVCPIMVQSY